MSRSTVRPTAGTAEARPAGVLVALAVAGLTCLVFLPALGGGFLPWDDESNLVANRAWRGRLGRYADAQRHLEQARAIVLSRTR